MKKFLENPVVKVNLFPLNTDQSNNIRVMKIEVNNEVAIPINKVVANPWIGPVPKINNTAPVNTCVTLASTIERMAPFQPNEVFTASSNVLPERNSSLARS